ncbi:MAG: sigma-70 family RNA polymerase sigma factor [Chloroflexi bacterium]|nr:sigma-70 family RNA polymerase sigma factor [Chloroflexota bacterium]
MFLRRQAQDAAGTRAAVARLFETHFERVVRYIAVRIRDAEEAQDLASDVFTKALRAAETFRETGAPMEAWLFKIAHNVVVDHLRKQGRRPAREPLDETMPVAGGEDPVEGLEREQELALLRQAMEHLTEAQRQVLALRFGGEMTSEQVAKMLGKSPGAIREMQSAAVKRLRQIMAQEEQGL